MSDIPTFPPHPSRVPQVLGTILLGLVSGAMGTLLLFWLYPELRQAQIPPGSQAVIVQQPGRVVVEEGTQLENVRQNAQPLIGQVFHTADAVAVGGTTIYPPNKRLGYAVMLTSDGLFGTVSSVPLLEKDVVVVSGKAYVISRLVRDPASPYVVGKLEGVSSLPVTSFVKDTELSPGMTIVAATSDAKASRLSLWSRPEPIDQKSVARSSDVLGVSISIVERVALPAGTPIFDLRGSLVGLVDVKAPAAIYPASALESLLNHVLAGRGASRPLLGLRYVSLPVVDAPGRSEAVIFDEKKESAVLASSPAGKAKLASGDKITSVGGNTVNLQVLSLFAMLQAYKPGDTVAIQYLRNGKAETANVVLTELK